MITAKVLVIAIDRDFAIIVLGIAAVLYTMIWLVDNNLRKHRNQQLIETNAYYARQREEREVRWRAEDEAKAVSPPTPEDIADIAETLDGLKSALAEWAAARD